MRCEHNSNLAAPFLHAMKRKTFDGEDGLHTAIVPSSSEAISDDPVLESKHKIFLSHSGVQKEFVDHLCKALEERCHYPFFDRRPESLPKGKKFPGLIFQAIQQCQLFVVVISEEYFMSKWPMIELNAFVKATKEMKSNMNRGILPLFYGLSVSELKDEKRRQRWFEKWETFARDDMRGLIKVGDWKLALDELTKFNGLPYDRELKEVVEYENEIVSHICKLVAPDIKWEDSHVRGHAHEVVIKKMNEVRALQLGKVKVVGLYGVGGIGKTTICKTLCNELSSAFEGRVCHIEFENTSTNSTDSTSASSKASTSTNSKDNSSSSSKELLQKVLIKLTRKSPEVIQQLDEGECKDVLHKSLLKQKTFLAIDNVWDNADSIKQALLFLKAPFHPDSLVLVTTRGQRTLELLGVDGVACLEMPELGQGDATNLFLHYATNGQQYTSEEDMGFIDLCVKRCYFSKGDGRGFQYHPLALEALGRQLGCLGKNPSKWVEILSSVWNFNAFSGANEVFNVLRSSFDLLRPIEQALFVDVGIFLRHIHGFLRFSECPIQWSERLCAIHKQDERQMQTLLESLKGKGLLQDADLALGKISMHDLYREFVVLEAKGKLVEATGIRDRRWAYVDIHDGDLLELEVTPIGGYWANLTRLFVDQGDGPIAHPMESFWGIEWHYFPNVQVLQLCGLNTVEGTLNLKGMKSLRSLWIRGLSCIERLEGLEGLMNLTLFEWTSSSDEGSSKLKATVGQFPRSLKYVDIRAHCVLSGLNFLARCYNLCKLTLMNVEVGVQLDLSNCLSLEHVLLSSIDNLQTLVVLSTRMASRLRSLDVGRCFHLVDIRGLDQLVCLEHLTMSLCASQKMPYVPSLTEFQTLLTHGGPYSIELHNQHPLQELIDCLCKSIKVPNLIGFNQLQVLDFSWSYDLESLSEMGDLPALRSLDLHFCLRLMRLPNLSKSRNLEELDLDGCLNLKLHEEDIQTLATLPSLHPVHFSAFRKIIKLDPVRRKLLQHVGTNGLEDKWEERELGQPPIIISQS